jgi:septation ring formation regulator EzrA
MSEQHKQFGEELSYLEKEFQNLKNQIHQFILHKN